MKYCNLDYVISKYKENREKRTILNMLYRKYLIERKLLVEIKQKRKYYMKKKKYK